MKENEVIKNDKSNINHSNNRLKSLLNKGVPLETLVKNSGCYGLDTTKIYMRLRENLVKD